MKIKIEEFIDLIESHTEQRNFCRKQMEGMRGVIRASIDKLSSIKEGEEYPPIEDVFTEIDEVIKILGEYYTPF